MPAVAFEAVIVDRDGVINHDSTDFIRSAEQWQPLPGALDGLALLHTAGLPVGVATNQSGLARGVLDDPALACIHARLQRELAAAGGHIDSIRWCPHGPRAGCVCRKPQPGLLHAVAADLGVALASAAFVGDSLRDMQAAMAGGCTPVLVLTGNGTRDLDAARALGVGHVFDDLQSACRWLAEPWR